MSTINEKCPLIGNCTTVKTFEYLLKGARSMIPPMYEGVGSEYEEVEAIKRTKRFLEEYYCGHNFKKCPTFIRYSCKL